MRKVPELRFDGFDREWEENKLSKVAKFSKGKGYSKTDLKNSGNPIYLYGEMYTNYKSQINDVETFTDKIKANSVLSKGNEVLIPSSGETAIDLARASHMNIPKVLLGGDLNIIEPINGFDPHFLALELSNGTIKQSLAKKAQGKSVVHLYNTDIKNQKFNYPVIEEQEKIGELFKKIDDLIEIQEGKVSKMEDFKKSMLQKMFPKKDELVPEFRFDGFDGEWESTKLSYISNRVTRRNLENQSKLPLTISSEFGLVNQLDYYNNRVASKDISNYYLIINGEFAYNKSTSLGAPYGAIKRLDNYENGALSTLYIVFKIVENNLDFIKYYFETSLWHKEIYKVSQEGARNHGLLNIATNDFFSMRIKLPPLAEQEKIGQFFKNLDAQIDTEKKLLDSYKDMKKSLLQKMFV